MSKKSNKNRPMTLEGCVVRISDIIGYIGRDIEDAIRIGKIKREDVLDKMLDYLASQISSLTNSSNIANSINVKSSNKIDDGLIIKIFFSFYIISLRFRY